MSSEYGKKIHLSIFGQSHGEAVGVVIDGLPAGERLDMQALFDFLARRAPGRAAYATSRKEGDIPRFLSGLTGEYTCGAPLCAVFENSDVRPGDYAELHDLPRPGHADWPAFIKHGSHRDALGGGHFSARLTAPLCLAGGILLQLFARRGVQIGAHILSIAGEQDAFFNPVCLTADVLAAPASADFPVLLPEAGERMRAAISAAAAEGDSVGGVVECGVIGLPPGVGAPMFDGLENNIAKVLFAIPAVKGVEFGAGFAAATLRGSQNNDPFCIKDGVVRTASNHHGGILGGLSSGMPIVFRAAFKPTPSISRAQQTVHLSRMEETVLSVSGRHDACVVPRAVPCVEAAAAIALADFLL